MAPEPKEVEVPLALVPCQYQVVPAGGVPERVIVTEVHCGELLVGLFGAEVVLVIETEILPLVELQQPEEFSALM